MKTMENERLTADQIAALRAQLKDYDVPVNAAAKLLNISEGSMQRFLSGKYAMPVSMAKVFEAVIEFRKALDERAQKTEPVSST